MCFDFVLSLGVQDPLITQSLALIELLAFGELVHDCAFVCFIVYVLCSFSLLHLIRHC